MNINGEELDEDRFENPILANKSLLPNDLSKIIFKEIKIFRGEAEQSDDIILGILKFR